MRLAIAILSVVLFANQASAEERVEFIESFQQSLDAPYRLFNTTNVNTLIALETSTGKLYQIHPGIGENAAEGIIAINEEDLTPEGSESESNRFTLYPTPNIYSFILVDQLAGRFWRVQWNYEYEKRFIKQLIPKF